MQPMLLIRSAVPGMVFVNGRFAGEAGEDSAVSMPVGARGTLYIELKPLQSGYLPLARRIAMSQGRPVPASLEGQKGLMCVFWPGGALEVELMPERARLVPPSVLTREGNGLTVRLIRGADTKLELARGDLFALHALPDGAEPPEVIPLSDGGLILTGNMEGGQYLLALGEALEEQKLFISGRQIELGEDYSVRALVEVGDLVGHARLLTWSRVGGEYVPNQTETLWAHGSPNWPDSPESTALAALEAALLGLNDEMGAYFTPGFQAQGNEALREAAESDGCVRLKYAMPDGRQAVGMVKLRSEQLAEVTPVYYHALPLGGSQGMWRIDQMAMGTDSI